MSDDDFTFPDTARVSPPDGQSGSGSRPGGDAGAGRSLNRQVAEVIRHVLADPDPEGEWARSQLRERLAAYPEHPERALLEHLILTRSLTGAAEDATAAHPGEDSAGTPLSSGADGTGSLDAGRIHRIEEVLENRMVLTALQPVRRLPAGGLVGFEALARFVSTDGSRAATWFRDAAALGLGMDLEIAALESAITAGQEIPAPLLIAVKLSPAAITDARVQYLLLTSALAPDRIVIDFMGQEVAGQDGLGRDGAGQDGLAPSGSAQGGEGNREAFQGALDSLRRYGVRVSMDFPGEGSSAGRIREIRPDVIKLGRDFFGGLGGGQAGDSTAVVRGLARETGAVLVAEGIETRAELDAVLEAGVTAGQGFLLGRPSANPDDWTAWVAEADGRSSSSSTLPGGGL